MVTVAMAAVVPIPVRDAGATTSATELGTEPTQAELAAGASLLGIDLVRSDNDSKLLCSSTATPAQCVRGQHARAHVQADTRLMQLVDDMLRPESLPRGWRAQYNQQESIWWVYLGSRPWHI
jgi:hypothetical protein